MAICQIISRSNDRCHSLVSSLFVIMVMVKVRIVMPTVTAWHNYGRMYSWSTIVAVVMVIVMVILMVVIVRCRVYIHGSTYLRWLVSSLLWCLTRSWSWHSNYRNYSCSTIMVAVMIIIMVVIVRCRSNIHGSSYSLVFIFIQCVP